MMTTFKFFGELSLRADIRSYHVCLLDVILEAIICNCIVVVSYLAESLRHFLTL